MSTARRTAAPAFAALCALLAAFAAAPAQSPAGYHVAKRIRLGGAGGWDYLVADPTAHRLFITRGTHVMVVDTDRDSVVADIDDTPGVHGVAFDPALGHGYTSNGRDSSVTVFDLRTLAPIARVKVTGRNPDAILFEPRTGRVFTFNGGSADATAIDAAHDSVVGTIALGGKPETGVADGTGHVFVNIEDRSEIVAFDARTLKVENRWSLAPCEEPTGLALDAAHARLVVGCGNARMAIVDTRSGRVVTTIPTGEGTDASAFDPATQLAFTSNGEGTLSVVREDAPDRFTLVGNLPTQRGARTMALDPRTHRVYTVTSDFGPAPAPTADRPRPRPTMVPGSFTLLVLER